MHRCYHYWASLLESHPLVPFALLSWVLTCTDAKVRMNLVYLKYWTLNLVPLMVYPQVIFHPNFSIKAHLRLCTSAWQSSLQTWHTPRSSLNSARLKPPPLERTQNLVSQSGPQNSAIAPDRTA